MKYYYFLALCFFSIFQWETALSQNLNTPCGADYWHEKALQDPGFSQKNQEYEQDILQVFKQKKTYNGVPDQAKVIPVVVHIIHNNGAENITDAEAQQAIIWLNQALANQGNFNQGSGADAGIQLCLAQRTPEGQSTNGITRNQSALTEMQMETQDLSVKNLNRWKPKDYVNIWVVSSICSNTYGCGVYGYANYPFAHGSNIDGIVIEAEYLTQIAKIMGLAHEMGHYLGLYHSFEGGCTNNNCLVDGDRICDTPPDQSTAGVPCGSVISTCFTDFQSGPFTSDQSDMIWNFMDYGVITCFHDYTPDQATRMNATLDGVRKSLLDSKGCFPPCPSMPTIANFNASSALVPVGQTVTFTNTSQNAQSYSWSINGQVFSGLADASYQFTTPGLYTIMLTSIPGNPTLCESDTAQFILEAICSVTADFNLSNLSILPGASISVINTSQNADQYEWFVNGTPYGNVLDTLTFTDEGAYEIKLIAHNDVCSSAITHFIYVLGEEHCNYKTFQLTFDLPADTTTIKFEYQAATLLADSTLLFSTSTKDGHIYFLKSKINGKQIWTRKVPGTFPTSLIGGGRIVQCATTDKGFVMLLNGTNQTSIHFRTLAKFSASGDFEWSRVFEDAPEGLAYLTAVVSSLDGGIVVSGGYESGGMLWAKFDLAGNQVWTQHFEIANSVLGLDAIEALPDGDFFAIGRNNIRCMVIRIKANGALGWRRSYAFLQNVQFAQTLKTLQYASIENAVYYAESDNVFIKFDTNGTKQLALQFPYYGIATQKNGEIIFFGKNDPSSNTASLLRTAEAGIPVWANCRPNIQGQFFDVVINPNGQGYYGIGTLQDPATSKQKLWVMRFDETGKAGDCTSQEVVVNLNQGVFNSGFFGMTALPAPVSMAGSTLLVSPDSLSRDTLCTPTCLFVFEDCNNGLDDDADNLFDCLDPDCPCFEDNCSPNQANLWYFGDHAGLDFNSEPPKLLTDGNSNTQFASSVACDATGRLLFYAAGGIYNRFHQLMPNSAGTVSGEPIIIPHPGDPTIFYLFAVYPGLRYYIIDMKKDDGRGDVVDQSPILESEFLGIAATKACPAGGYWGLFFRKVPNTLLGEFWALKVDENGLNSTPVISNIIYDVSWASSLRISPNGKKAALIYRGLDEDKLAIYDFDSNLGVVSNPQILKLVKANYYFSGVEFSSNSRFVYALGNISTDTRAIQFDLEAGDLNAIKNSMTTVASGAPDGVTGQLHLAPNGKIYGPRSDISQPLYYLDVIHTPNQPGIGCHYQTKGVDLSGTGGATYGLCNVISSYLQELHIFFPYDAPDTICTLNTPIKYYIPIPACEVDSIRWETQNLSTQIQSDSQHASISYLEPGEGQLIVTAYTPCGITADTLHILVVAPLSKMLDLGPDLVVCDNGVFTFNAGSGFAKYLWSDGTADSTVTTLFPGTYWVKAWDACGNAQTDSITVSIAASSVLDLGPDLPQQCAGFSANYQRPANFESWQWSPNDFLSCTDCPNVTILPDASTRWIVLGQTAEGCISIDTLNATIRDTLIFSRDTFVCVGKTLALFGTQLPADTTAEFLLPAPALGCDTLLTVNVLGIDNAASEVVVKICADAFFEYNGALLPADTVAIFHLSSAVACDSAVTVRVNAYPALTLSLPMDTTIRIGASVLLDAELVGTATLNLVWTPMEGLSCFACPDPLANPLDTITYTLSVTDMNGCTAQESVTIRVNEECRVRIPNAFTPNGDGSNDVFRPVLDACVRTVRLWKILNRWGHTVFEQVNSPASDPKLDWDGTWEGKPQPSDVLIWLAEFEYYDGRRESKSGQVTLIR